MRALRSGAGLPARRQPQPRTGPGAAGAAQLARSPPSEPAEVSGWLRGGKVWGGPCGFIGFWGSPTLCGFLMFAFWWVFFGGGEGGAQYFAFLSRGGYHFASLHGEGEYRHRFGSLCSPPQPYPCTGGLDAVHPCLGRGPLSLRRFSRWRESRTPQLWWRFLPMHGVGVSGCLHLPSGRSPRALSMGGSRSLCIRTWSVWGGGG